VYTLVGTFVLADDVPRAISMDADVNIALPGLDTIPSFWDVLPAGCNASAFSIIKTMPADCGGHVNAFCGADTGRCDLLYAAERVPGTNVLRLSVTVTGGALNAAHLHGGQPYFAFALNIPMLSPAGCPGCSAPAALGFARGTIYALATDGSLEPPIVVSATYPGARACASANDGYADCTTVPVRRPSWGRLKSLYR